MTRLRQKALGVAVAAMVVAAAAPASAESEAVNGAAVYADHCARCHTPNWINRLRGAPRAGSDFWTARAETDGIDALVARTLRGQDRMPAQRVSEAQARAAVNYLIETAGTD
ncbi:c-type cytochrome [Polycyclovorans algicola]|uniref:c-type cytochrome n=1 Tax=Polycyclovorans algicola TaxID=616992 RepID=UPI00126934B4|nr:cytochrome c [Polycyclovorans algicola]